MPSPVATGNAYGTKGGTAQNTKSGSQTEAPVVVVPFVRASQLHRELVNDNSKLLTAADQDQGSIPVPAYGYLRSIVLLVEGTGGVNAGTTTFAEDGPWSVLKNVILQEPNGATIAQFNSGYELYLANKYGGFRGYNNPERGGAYAATSGAAASGNFSFLLRVPVELNVRDALGSLPNQNSAAAFQIRYTLAASATVYSAAPTTLPTVRVRIYAEEWDQPDVSTDGMPNQTTPPSMNSTQYHSIQSYTVNSGDNTIRLTRVGNYIRNLGFIFRSSSTRSGGETNWPDTASLWLDTRPMDYVQKKLWRTQIYERYGYNYDGASAFDGTDSQDNGVFWYDFTHEFDGIAGHENRDLWLPTLGSTRLELQGTFGASGVLTVITNDVSVASNVFL